MKLTENEIITIIKNKTISKCTESERKQVMFFAFGENYINSDSKGKKQVIKWYLLASHWGAYGLSFDNHFINH